MDFEEQRISKVLDSLGDDSKEFIMLLLGVIATNNIRRDDII